MGRKIKIVLTGLNGYGKNFITALLKEENLNRVELVGVVSRNPKASEHYEDLVKRGIWLYTSLEACLAENQVDLAVITTPMHIHYEEVMCALRHGVNVFCEKPLAPTIDECLEIQKVAKEQGKFVAVGFQWSYSKAIQQLKKDILNGRYGKVKSIKTIVSWNRPKRYFKESNWRGKIKGEDGKYILESVMSNGAAHFLHNLFFLCGETMQQSAYPISIQGEGYRAHQVEGYDTVFLRMLTSKGQELLYLATIAAKQVKRPRFTMELEKAVINFPEGGEENIVVHTQLGEEIIYGSPEEGRFEHFLKVAEAIHTKEEVPCSIETILPHTIAVNAAMEYIPVCDFPRQLIYEDENYLYVKGLEEVLELCYETKKLPNELEVGWSTPNKNVMIRNYYAFKGIADKKSVE